MHDRLTGREDYLVGYWSMQEGDGKRLGDHSANANHGTIIGGTWTSRLPVDPKQP